MNKIYSIKRRKAIYDQGRRVAKECNLNECTKQALVTKMLARDKKGYMKVLLPICLKYNSEAPALMLETITPEEIEISLCNFTLGVLNAV